MKRYPKLTFLIAAHNEEKIITKAIERLLIVHKDYNNIEVLVGADGCTDNTFEIVKKFSRKYNFIEVFKFNERNGKQAVLDKLTKYITGEIIVIHDADWSFVYKSKKDLLNFINIFRNKKIGGIAEGISSEFSHPDFWNLKSLPFIDKRSFFISLQGYSMRCQIV